MIKSKFRLERTTDGNNTHRGCAHLAVHASNLNALNSIKTLINKDWRDNYSDCVEESHFYNGGFCCSWFVNSYDISAWKETYKQAKKTVNCDSDHL